MRKLLTLVLLGLTPLIFSTLAVADPGDGYDKYREKYVLQNNDSDWEQPQAFAAAAAGDLSHLQQLLEQSRRDISAAIRIVQMSQDARKRALANHR